MKVEPFRIVQEETNEQYILHLIGELDLSVVQQLRDTLEPVISRTDKDLVLNLKQLTYIDSTGIGIIVSILKLRVGLNAPFFVIETPPGIKRLFDLTGITKYLTEGTEAEA
ncbi:STAS domain-containing protein [Cohnella soli]|uniref:Anti-sigma factor antagonist n=1 Tax=Cohnella soli TaxID=425005 RepID=A0ABW0HVW2_9BACL